MLAIFLFIAADLLFVGALILSILFLYDTLRGHDLPTSREATQEIVRLVRTHKPDARNFYDLGCARGSLALAIKKYLPELEVYAIDSSALRLFFARLKARLLGRHIRFQKEDVFKIDLRNADVVYAYLWYDRLPPLEAKAQKELAPGVLAITNTVPFPKWKPKETVIVHTKNPDFEKLFLYVKDQSEFSV